MAKNPLDELLEGLFGKNPTGRQPSKQPNFGAPPLAFKVEQPKHKRGMSIKVMETEDDHWHSLVCLFNEDAPAGSIGGGRLVEAEFCADTRAEALSKATGFIALNESVVFPKAEEDLEDFEPESPPSSYQTREQPLAPSVPTSDVGPQS